MSASKIWEWMNNNMFKTVFVLTFISDFWANWYSYAIVHDWIVLQAFLGAVLPFINLPGSHDNTNDRSYFWPFTMTTDNLHHVTDFH